MKPSCGLLLVLACSCGRADVPAAPSSATVAEKPSASAPPAQPTTPNTVAEPGPPEGTMKDDTVLEAVFRHMLRETPASTKDGICLRVRRTANEVADASDALVASLRATWPTARKASECEGGGPKGPVHIKGSSDAATMFDIGPVEWDSDGAARVKGASHTGGPNAREIEFRLEKGNHGWWRVTGEKVVIET